MIPQSRFMYLSTDNTTSYDILALVDGASIESLQNSLPRERYHFLFAKTVGEAIEMLSERHFDLALIDPQVDVFYTDVLRMAHRTGELAFLPVILLVADEGSPAIVPGLEAGADGYVTLNTAPGILEARLMLHIGYTRKLQARDQTIAELLASRDAHDRMVQMVTHDLMHPVTNIRMATELLRQARDDKARNAILDSVDAALVSMQEALEDFNAASSIQLDSLQFAIEPIPVNRLMHEVFLANAARIDSKAMKVTLPESRLSVHADHDKLRRVLENLVTNAVKYSPGGSTITLDASQIDAYVRLTVKDEGPGIPKDELHLLYTKFGRLSTRPTGEETSTGLGLWIVKTLVEAMDGRIGVDSEFGQGATFWVELPLAAEDGNVAAD